MNVREIAPIKRPPLWRLDLPGSKSITNRAFLCAALCEGTSRIYGALRSDDTEVMVSALRDLGASVEDKGDHFEVRGRGGVWSVPRAETGDDAPVIDLHNAGTATRFLTAALCLTDRQIILTGNKRMCERPIGDLVDALRQLGARIEYEGKGGFPPLRIYGGIVGRVFGIASGAHALHAGHSHPSYADTTRIRMKGDKSSQYFSALLMLAPLLDAPLTIEVEGDLVSKPYMDVTLDVMRQFGVGVENDDYRSFTIHPQRYEACDFNVEGDASAATYWTAIAKMHGGRVAFGNLGENSTQGDYAFGPLLSDLMDSPLAGRDVDMNGMPDAAMTLAVCAPFLKGDALPPVTHIQGLSTLRIKETDRIAALKTELLKVGIEVDDREDSMTIKGAKRIHLKEPLLINTYDDHRMAMCFAVLGTMLPGIIVNEPDCVKKTYPDFWLDFERAYLSPVELGDRNLVLTGMRCSGKTHYGRKIAEVLGRPFVDLDEEIERDQGMSISRIVEEQGWDYFRDIEQKICSKFSMLKGHVIATGGGVVLRAQNMKALKKNGFNVFIFVDPGVLTERVRKYGENRPALGGDSPSREVRDIWGVRRELYLEHADAIWDDSSGQVIEGELERIFG